MEALAIAFVMFQALAIAAVVCFALRLWVLGTHSLSRKVGAACLGLLAVLAVVIVPSAIFVTLLVLSSPGLFMLGVPFLGAAALSAWALLAAVQTVRLAIDAPPKPTAASRTVAE